MRRATRFLLGLLIIASPSVAMAVDGVIEINETCATASGCLPGDVGGYPVVIASSGSYVLTSDLTPQTSVDAILITASNVTIDMNGFGISFPAALGGSGDGIEASGAATIFDGRIVNAPDAGIFGGNGMRIERTSIVAAGGICIRTAGGAVIRNNQVSNCGGDGINTFDGAEIVDNVIFAAGRSGSGNGIETRDHSLIRGNQSRANATNGIFVGYFQNPSDEFPIQGVGAHIAGNNVSDNDASGIDAGLQSLVINNTVVSNGQSGILVGAGSSVRSNVARGNSTGLSVGLDSTYRENTVTANSFDQVVGGVNRGDNYCAGTGTTSAFCP